MVPSVIPSARLLAAADLSAVLDGLQQRWLWLPAPTEPRPARTSCAAPSELRPASSAAGSPEWQSDTALRATPRPFYDAQHPFAPSPMLASQQRGRTPASQRGRGYATSWQAEQDAQAVQKLLRLLQDIPHHR